MSTAPRQVHAQQPDQPLAGDPHAIERPRFTAAEVDAVLGRGTPNGLSGLVPARCYWDEGIYRFEVEHILKKHWLAVGRWDWAEKPGDYFTSTMFGQPLLIIRGKDGELRCLVNSCRHRWSQIVDDGCGNTKLLVCPYHRWSYNLDGTLRGVSAESIPGLDRAKCALPGIRLEVWQGTIFINFDPNAAPLGPQLAGLESIIGHYKIGEMRSVGRTTYDTTWNYKLSLETGYEAYHHCGLHFEKVNHIEPPAAHEPVAFGDIWGLYAGRLAPEFERQPEWRYPYGRPPWMSDEEFNRPNAFRSYYAAVYPGWITYISPHQITMITVEHIAVDRNRASTHTAVAPWALAQEGSAERVEEHVEMMKAIQEEDSFGCRMLQKGVRAATNDHSVLHPRFESTLAHYHRWLLNQYQTA